MRRTPVLILALAIALALASAALAVGTLTLDRHVIGGGGGRIESGSYSLDATIGQPVAGTVGQGRYTLCSGYWCGARASHTVYLPLVMR